MNKLLLAGTMFMAVAGKSGAEMPPNPVDPIASSGGSVTLVDPDWRVVCMPEQIDDLGDVTIQTHCRLEKENATAIVEISRRGVSILMPQFEPLCDNGDPKISVDRKSITRLSTAKQIRALSNGKAFARHQEWSWPQCSLTIETVDLTGFSGAYRELTNRWKTMGR